MPYETPPWTQVVAHRGNSGPMPENTLAAIESAIGLVKDFTWDELKTRDAGSWRGPEYADDSVRALDEILDLTRGRVALNLDIKVPEAAELIVIAAIKAGVAASVVISGCTAKCVQTVGDMTSDIATLLNLDELLLGIDPAEAHTVARNSIDLAIELGAMAINVPHPLVDSGLVEQAREAGIGVWTFTIDEESQFLDLMNMGVASLATNWPERMLPLAREVFSE